MVINARLYRNRLQLNWHCTGTKWNYSQLHVLPNKASYLLMNCIIFSKSHTYVLTQHMSHFKATFFSCICFVLRSMYSSISRINWITATMNAPKATLPREGNCTYQKQAALLWHSALKYVALTLRYQYLTTNPLCSKATLIDEVGCWMWRIWLR